MIKINEIKGFIVREGLTQGEVAKALGISQKTFGYKMRKGVFKSDEIEKLIVLLKINDPVSIFFSPTVA